MKLNKEEKEIEALFEREEIVLAKPDKALLKQLRTAAENTFRRIVASISDCRTTTWLGSSGLQLPRVSPTSH